ncbi:MAG: hypothetical protein B7Z14_10270 [Bosea sp. 32-68-6]|nr:MAG: hypothetical protein B7Z14_10270 [Bosea sp. 32-68-6]
MTILVAIVGLIESAIWPAALIWALWYFRDDIKLLAARIEEASPTGGIKLKPSQAEKQIGIETDDKGLTTPATLGVTPNRTPAMLKMEELIKRDLDAAVTNGVIRDGDRLSYTISSMAVKSLENHFLKIYMHIFGTQIEGLRLLRERGGVSVSEARAHFSALKAANPQFYGVYGYDDWVGYLLNAGMIEVADDNIRITELGEDFLLFLHARNLRTDKAG